ncbi:MAG TPA: hypothetical protein VLD35_01505 [Caldimonas sp.]|nr:hypothetical protein [Caldimonas sp.]
MNLQDSLETFKELGLKLPSPLYLAGVVVFGLIGLVAYYHGKRLGRSRMRWVGLALMLYPYAVWQTWLLYLVGTGLSIAAWLDRP